MRKLLPGLLACILLFASCKKDSSPYRFNDNSSFVTLSLSYLSTNLPKKDYAKLDLKTVNVLKYQDDALGVQVFEKNTSDKFLILQNNGGVYTGNWVDISLLKKSELKNINGEIRLENLNNKSSTRLIVVDNKVVEILDSNFISENTSTLSTSRNITSQRPDIVIISIPYITLPEVVIYVSNDSPGYTSLYWLSNQDLFYTHLYYQNSGGAGGYSGGGGSGGYYGGGGGGSPVNNTIAVPSFSPPDKPIVDIEKELAAFTNHSNSTYTITVNITQPEPTTREVVNPYADFIVGHTFITLQQHNADGTSIIRNVGFYPMHGVKPWASKDESVFGDDSNTLFDVSIGVTVTGTEFMNVVSSILKQKSIVYDMNNFNCTNSAIDALGSIHINLPSTKSNDFQFSGNSPADLGEDIRNLDIKKFSDDNGKRKVTKTVSNFNDKKPPAREG